MKRMLVLLATLAGVAVLAGFRPRSPQATRGTVYLGMDTPLTGPQAIVGQGDREAILALAAYWNRGAASTGVGSSWTSSTTPRPVTGSPEHPEVHLRLEVRRDPRLGQRRGGRRDRAPRNRRTDPVRRSLAPDDAGRAAAPVRLTWPMSRLYAYSMAQYLKRLGVQRIALMGDNGGFGRDGVAQVETLAKAYGFTITESIIFAPTTTSFAAELVKVKNSAAQALWMWTVTPAANTIVKEFAGCSCPSGSS